MPWKLTERVGPRVRRRRFDELDSALDALRARARELAGAAPAQPVDVRFRRFEPGEQVVARLELAGPQRLVPSARGGVDVRGDGSVHAYRGRVRRRELAAGRDGAPYAALRRALSGG